MLNNSKEVQLPILEEEAIVPSAAVPSALLLSVSKHQEEHLSQMLLQNSLKTVCSFMFKKHSFPRDNIATGDLLQSALQMSAHTPQKKRFYCINVSEEDGAYGHPIKVTFHLCSHTCKCLENLMSNDLAVHHIQFSCFYKANLLQI